MGRKSGRRLCGIRAVAARAIFSETDRAKLARHGLPRGHDRSRTRGFCDVSTLGKIELQGRDVGAFLDRLYINMFSTLAVGRARYGLMLREDGFALDDGTTSRLSEDRFFMTTTTANADRVFRTYAILPSGAVARTGCSVGVEHGSMGAILGGGALARATLLPALSTPRLRSTTMHSLTWRLPN